MKKIIFLLVVLVAIPVMAQTNPTLSDIHKDTDNRTWLNADYKKQFPYPITVGVYGFLNVHTLNLGSYYGSAVNVSSHIGGGGALTAKISFKKWIALALDLSISGASTTFSSGMESSMRTFLLSPVLIFQRETPRGTAGWVPWIGIGLSLANNNWTTVDNVQDYYGNTIVDRSSVSGTSLGFLMNAGFKYNFKNNAFVGARADFSASSFFDATMINSRLGVEAGYRF